MQSASVELAQAHPTMQCDYANILKWWTVTQNTSQIKGGRTLRLALGNTVSEM